MSLSKHKRNPSRTPKDKHEEGNILYEHVRRIDGTEIVRKYVKCGLLGKGGFANCFVTENAETHKKAATKIVLKEQLKTHRTRLRLANEIKLHKALHHPNVVELYHCFEDKQNVYIFLQLCQNQSLNELIRVRSNFLTPEIQSFMFGIVSGLKYIHSQKIIHRDLKLGNIFIDSKFNIKIGDFGLATKLEFARECKRTVCGTPNYIAPQVLDGRGYHFEVDIWSIGVILYTLYFGIPPFQTQDANTTYQRIKECSYAIPKTMHTPNEAINLIQKILVRNPAQRPTLDDILTSDFMRLGQGILKELPAICSKKAPTKKDLNLSSHLPTTQLIKSASVQQQQLTKDYVVEFEEVLEDTFYYRLANQSCGILQKGVRAIYKRCDGKYLIRSLTNNYEEEAHDQELKYLLMSKEKKFNVLDEITAEFSGKGPTILRKVQRINGGWLLRLSNKGIQLLTDTQNYLLWGKKLWQLSGSKQKQLSISKLLNQTLRGPAQPLKILRKIVQQLQNKQQSSKENTNLKC